jgi:hypothetical protein
VWFVNSPYLVIQEITTTDHNLKSALNVISTHNLLVASSLKCPATLQLHQNIFEHERDNATALLATMLKAAQNQVNNCPIITPNRKLAVLKDT